MNFTKKNALKETKINNIMNFKIKFIINLNN